MVALNVEELESILRNEVFVPLPPGNLKEEFRLTQDLGVDSLGFAELRAALEARGGFRIEDEDFTPDNFSTVGSLLRYLKGRSDGL